METPNPDSETPPGRSFVEYATLMDIVRAKGDVSYDDLLALWSALGSSELSRKLGATDEEVLEINHRLVAYPNRPGLS